MRAHCSSVRVGNAIAAQGDVNEGRGSVNRRKPSTFKTGSCDERVPVAA
jgi:hypothetical protein